MSTNKVRTFYWTISHLVLYVMTLVVNYLGSSGFFNGKGQAEVSDKYNTMITPSGFAFSIWGVIYTLLFVSLVYLFVKRNEEPIARLVERISWFYVMSSVFNMGWIIVFSYELIGLSTIFILGLLFSLMLLIQRLYNDRNQYPTNLVGASFSLYAAWVFIASILNISLFLVQQQWNGWGIKPSIWTMVILLVAIVFVLGYVLYYRNAVFPIAPAWAFFGIYRAYQTNPMPYPMTNIIEIILLTGMGIFIVLAGWTLVRNQFNVFPKTQMLIK
ncbi:tryptophan-rich sensory protein [Atopobacter phocae]|uniref:tryptophan-rich sensory protein n=1 Tax=Atopobacter phocae TaxID=136492 RepID=UPI00047288C8|nr:tryptophan-rich sensory protein [Atopobacter phocae]